MSITSLCHSLATGVKNFGLGVAGATLFHPIQLGINTLAQKAGLVLPREDLLTVISELVNNLKNLGIPIDAKKITNATCHLNELITQINNYMPERARTSLFNLKTSLFNSTVIVAPINEEILFRGIVQGVVLKQIPSWIVKKYVPKLNPYLDSTVAKIARITITAVLFAAVHHANHKYYNESYVQGQILTALIGGIGLGCIKESNLGLLGAIGAHTAHNFLSMIPSLLMC